MHEGPGLSGFGQCPGILPSTENVAQSAGLGPDQTLTPSVSTSGPEGFGHPAPTLVRVSRGPQSSPPKSHTLWGRGGPQGDFPGFAESAAKGRSPRRAPRTAQRGWKPRCGPRRGCSGPWSPGAPLARLPRQQHAATPRQGPRTERPLLPHAGCQAPVTVRQRPVHLHGGKPWSPGKRWPQAAAPGSPEPMTSREAVLVCAIWARPVWQRWAQAAVLLGRSGFPGHGSLTPVCMQPQAGATCPPPTSAPGCVS